MLDGNPCDNWRTLIALTLPVCHSSLECQIGHQAVIHLPGKGHRHVVRFRPADLSEASTDTGTRLLPGLTCVGYM